MELHRAVINIQDDNRDHHHHRQDCIIVVWNRTDKDGESIFSFYEAGNGSSPGRNRRNNTYRSRRGVNQVCQLRPGYVVLIRYGTHDASYGQTVKIIVDENQYAKQDGCKLCAYPALDVFAGPPPECGGASRLVHQADHDSKNDQKHQDSDVIAVGQYAHDTVLEHMGNRSFKCEPRIEDSSYQDSDE